jgi:fumarylacetoacetate (FAA) hydrolase family protein
MDEGSDAWLGRELDGCRPLWTFGAVALMRNLVARGLLA